MLISIKIICLVKNIVNNMFEVKFSKFHSNNIKIEFIQGFGYVNYL